MFSFVKNISIILPLLLFIVTSQTKAQEGRITGKVTDALTGETLPGASVIIQGTNTGASSDLDGEFQINGLKNGRYTLQVYYISFKTQLIENVNVTTDKPAFVQIKLQPEAQSLEAVKIEATAIKESENIILLEQKKATEIVQQIGAQELSRKGVSDVATAVTKTTGVSKTEGSNNVYVRGLGDRYNSSTYNGLPLPSNNPEKKNISLDIFTTDIVEFISIDKVYNNRIYGDFAGGNVDISAKQFNADKPYLTVEVGTSFNTRTVCEKTVPLKAGPDFFGFYTTPVPVTITEYSFIDSPDPVNYKPRNISFSMSGGTRKSFGKDKENPKEFTIFSTLNYGNEYSVKEGVAFGAVNSSGVPHKSFKMKTFDYATNTTGMLNAGLKLSKKHNVNYNLLFINSSQNSNEQYKGTIIDIADNDNGYMNRRSYERNRVMIHQLLGTHDFSKQTGLTWGFGFNNVTSDIPDRQQNTYRMVDGQYYFGQNQITDNHRYYHSLKENEIAGNLAFTLKLFPDAQESYKLKLTVGGTTRFKTRDFSATQFNFRIAASQRETVINPDSLSSFFNQANLDNAYFRIETFRGNSQVPFALDPQVYGGTQIIHGGYLTAEYKPVSRFTALIGLRTEYIFQEVTWNTQLDPSDKSDDFEIIELLPSITTKYELTPKQNLRFAASKTYTLPQFKERAMFIYEEVTQVKLGNPDLYLSDNYNADLKWEFFPKPSEIVSLALFGKYIMNPINEFAITSATNDISFINTGDWGYVAGIEAEIRKDLFTVGSSRISAGFNTSYMITEQELNSDKVREETIYIINFTHERARFTGASDLLVNGDLSYRYNLSKETADNITATVSYSYFSDRIYAIGTNNRGNIIESPFNALDFIIKAEFKQFKAGITLKNLLDPAIERYQANLNKDVLVISYKKGRVLGLSLSYRF